MGAPGFCNVNQKEGDIRYLHAKVYHFQHQAFADEKSITLLYSLHFFPTRICSGYKIKLISAPRSGSMQ